MESRTPLQVCSLYGKVLTNISVPQPSPLAPHATIQRPSLWRPSVSIKTVHRHSQGHWGAIAKLSTTELPLLPALVKPLSAVLDFGVNTGSQLTMAEHVAALRRLCLVQLRQLQMVRSLVTVDAIRLVYAFVSSRYDYCNSLLYGISDGLLTELRTLQHAPLHVITGTRKFDHITPVLTQQTPLAFGTAVNYLQVGDDHLLTLPSRSGAILPGWRVSSVVGRW